MSSAYNLQSIPLHNHWQSKELPGINCLVLGNGKVVILNIYTVKTHDGSKKQYAFPVCDTTVESLEFYNDDIWTEIEISPNDVGLGENIRIVCGEGGMGNEGFIAKTQNGQLTWALFSIESNPFVRLELVGEFVNAFSNTNVCYEININNPLNLNIKM